MVVSTKNTEHYKWGADCDGWHLAKTDNLSVIQEHVPPGASEARHYHEKANQFFFVLSGEATLAVEGVDHKVGADQGLYVEAGKAHQLRNESDKMLVFLVVSSPKSHGDRVDLNS